ncbi:hypothetical protein HMPREF9075_01875, partial [Capnocytophaga sp. oral taxon 332 str. F0381]
LLGRGNGGGDFIQNSLYIPHTALLRTAPSLLGRGNGGEDFIHNSSPLPLVP